MIRKPRSYLPHLRTEYSRQHPGRPPKENFDDEILVLLAFIMRQLDPDGRRPIIEPPMPAEGYQPQPSVRSTSRKRVLTE